MKFPNILYDSFVNLIADYNQKFSFNPINVGKKPPLPAFLPVTSRNVGIGDENFLNFSFNTFDRLV